ncbi:aminotransferase class I/II-fold pyridoxal phosphate-dependent enzyme [Limimaricola pyoseonensis]|uniref:Aminotransferase n=1 Tax=Limimaricola pyoseonensis TaxID=521013 RepID=A0A1G7E790_9RHOB|nr:aminotransferase class I/II-fold pyridoxal phosphate-dependent enzyme [Limimaricola pyoseonensis]SDE59255.1 Aspartate/methionine/tyrosine aminotransferase [Limimaricola pyoseonensis]
MDFPERFSDLPEYAFPRLRALLDSHAPGGAPLAMTIGEPQHRYPDWVAPTIAEAAAGFGKYPVNEGSEMLLGAISGWIGRRYGVAAAPERLLALNGTREGLYNAAMALCPETKAGARPLVLMPNPFYQVYAVAALSVGAEPVYLPATRETGFLPDLDAIPAKTLDRTAIFYLCSPSNPQGAVASEAYLKRLMDLAERHDFRVFADECYSEIWRTAPPPGALAVAEAMGADPERLVVFNSLSKRSNLPGLRAGFAASGPESTRRMRQLRNYAGAPLPLPLQAVAAKAWSDEAHVDENRALYAAKYDIADRVLGGVPGYAAPEAGFFLWLPVDDGEAAALKLWRETGVRVLPGAYLGRDVGGENPGNGYVRVAMVAPADDMQRGLETLRGCLYD